MIGNVAGKGSSVLRASLQSSTHKDCAMMADRLKHRTRLLKVVGPKPDLPNRLLRHYHPNLHNDMISGLKISISFPFTSILG